MSRDPDSASVVRRYVAAVEAGDQQGIRELFAQDATWTLAAGDLPISGTWRGRDTILEEFLATALSHYQPGSVSLEITGLIADGDRVALQWTSRARTRDGDAYQNDCIGVFTIRAGKIHAVREYMDTLYAAAAFSRAPKAASIDAQPRRSRTNMARSAELTDWSSATWSAGSCETSGGGRHGPTPQPIA